MIMEQPRSVDDPSMMSVQSVALEGGLLVVVSGEIDAQDGDTLAAAMAPQPLRRIQVDLGEVSFFDCSTVSVLLRARDAARSVGGDLHLVGLSPFGQRLLDVLGMAETFFSPDRGDTGPVLGDHER